MKEYYLDRSKLPDDVEALKDIVIWQGQELQQQAQQLKKQGQQLKSQELELEQGRKRIASLEQQVAQLLSKIAHMEEQLATFKQSKYGPKSEKLKKSGTAPKPSNSPKASADRSSHRGRNKLPKHLARVRIEYDLAAAEKICKECAQPLIKIQEIMTERLTIIPARYVVEELVRFKYACRCCYEVIKTAEIPACPIDKGMVSAGVLAQVLMDKYGYHLPLYRQQQKFKHQGIELSRANLSRWIEQSAQLLSPLVEVMQQELLTGDHVFADDTPMPTLAPGLGKTKRGQFWVYSQQQQGDRPGMAIYQYTTSREGKHPQAFLEQFRGYVQTDAYSGFNGLFAVNDPGKDKQKKRKKKPPEEEHPDQEKQKPLRREVGCWAHGRRRLVAIVRQEPESRAGIPLHMIQELYALDKQVKASGLPEAQQGMWRRKHSKQIIKKLDKWLRKEQKAVPPKSAFGKAIAYLLNHWRALTIFRKDGRLELDNNRSERAMRPIALGRKNYLFMGSPQSGKAAAIVYSLIATCQQHKVDPEAYLKDVLERVSTHPQQRIKELLPYNWQPLTALSQAA